MYMSLLVKGILLSIAIRVKSVELSLGNENIVDMESNNIYEQSTDVDFFNENVSWVVQFHLTFEVKIAYLQRM